MSTFRGIKLFCQDTNGDYMAVEESISHDDSLYFKADAGAILNRRQVRELAARLKAWLDQSGDDDENDEWENIP